MDTYDIVIIDSGINQHHKVIMEMNCELEGCMMRYGNGGAEIDDEMVDTKGHGTGVFFIIHQKCPTAKIYNIGIVDNDGEEESLCDALTYIYENIKCKIINISCGVAQLSSVTQLAKICRDLKKQGVIIVSAFSNDGVLSYPACLPSVIGVDTTTSLPSPHTYQYVNSDVVNIRYSLFPVRVPSSTDSGMEMAWGSSYCAPFITSSVWRCLCDGIETAGIDEKLRDGAYSIINPQHYSIPAEPFIPKKAILYPFNKEIQTIVGFSKWLEWKLSGIYDNRYSRIINQKTNEIAFTYSKDTYVVQNVDNINWDDDFDTVIIGHTDKYERQIAHAFTKELIHNAWSHCKNVITFDEKYSDYSELFKTNNLQFYCPVINQENVPTDFFGKQYMIGKPVVGVFGTSPKQGKMAVQMILRKKLEEIGYTVGHFGTEPSSALLGCHETYNMGYYSTVHISRYDAITYVNDALHRIELTDPDIVIVGSQSQTIATSPGNIGFYPVGQYELLLGSWPDAVFLCVNIDDNIQYIKDTVKFIQSACSAQVIGAVLFPAVYKVINGVKSDTAVTMDANALEEKREKIENELGVRTMILGEDIGNDLADICVDFFGG